ncbi:Protocadherin Fat 4 [Papilio xuthus]|uniref:Protocadherin Fat 4 n=1 Tax=Papilio xuthus TaxID=66420 RepID=A0A194PTC6_PAPXU|nr:Protocadherin Fat 4 [Papilio xuthus]
MAARGRWRTRCRLCAALFAILIQVVNGYEQTYTISQLSPKSEINEKLNLDDVLRTTNTENLAFRIEPSAKFDVELESELEKIVDGEEEVDNHFIVARSADPNDRESRSINMEEIPTSNHNEIDNELELHNKRKYYDITPTKTLVFLHDQDEEMFVSSEGFGDKLNFKFPGEGKRVPKGRALAPTGPKVRPSAVQPIFATATHREQGRQNSEIQNIITGIVKLLNGNVNVQANTQLLNGRPGRPMASRINNRGPPKISDVPPLPDLEQNVSPPAFAFHPTPPPYPFDRPPYHGVNLPEQIVPPMTSHRPGYRRPSPPWLRPRPWPAHRRPNPSKQIYKPTPPPPPIDIPNIDYGDPEEVVNENESSHLENNIHHEDKETIPQNVPETNTPEVDEEIQFASEDTTTSTTTTTTSTTTTTTTTTTTEPTTTTTSTTTTTTTEKPTEKTTTTEKQTEPPTQPPTQPPTTKPPPTQPPTHPPTQPPKEKFRTTTEKPTTEKPFINKPEKDKEKDAQLNNKKDNQTKDKQKVVEEKPIKNSKNQTAAEHFIQSSISDVSSTTSSLLSPTPTEGLVSHVPAVIEPSINEDIKSSSINSQPLPPSQGIPYHPYRPRPGIVLDDPDFKPHGSRYRPEASVITAHEPQLPGYGEIFDVTVSAIQGPGEKGGASVHIQNVHAAANDPDDIIVSAAGSQGFVSIDGKRTYLNLFDSSTASIQPTKVQAGPHHTPPPPQSPQPALGAAIGTGVAIPADDVPSPPPRRNPAHPAHPPHLAHAPHTRPQTYRRPQPTVRIDTCIVGDDSTCDQAQNEKCRTESGISSCQCRPGYARRTHRDPCRRVVSLLLNLRVDRLYDRKICPDCVTMFSFTVKTSDKFNLLNFFNYIKRYGISSCQCRPGYARRTHRDPCRRVVSLLLNLRVDRLYDRKVAWDNKLADKDSEPYQQLSYEAVRAIDSAFSMTPFSDDFVSGSVNSIHQDVDECASSDLNDCHQLAACTNTWGAFKCMCPDTTLDAAEGSGRAGRECRACSASHCSDRGVCRYANGQPYCSCTSGYYGSTCEVDGEVVGVAVGASLAAALVIALTLAALLSWSWHRWRPFTPLWRRPLMPIALGGYPALAQP